MICFPLLETIKQRSKNSPIDIPSWWQSNEFSLIGAHDFTGKKFKSLILPIFFHLKWDKNQVGCFRIINSWSGKNQVKTEIFTWLELVHPYCALIYMLMKRQLQLQRQQRQQQSLSADLCKFSRKISINILSWEKNFRIFSPSVVHLPLILTIFPGSW